MPTVDLPADGHFLALGGTSIAAVSLSHLLENSSGLALKPDVILANPRFADQVALARPVADEPAREQHGPTAVSRGAPRMPSVMYRYMKHAIDGAFNTEYNLGFAWEVTGPLDVGALAAALRGCCERHEAFRLRYFADGADWKVYEARPDDPLEIVRLDLGQMDDDGLINLAERERGHPFMPRQSLVRGRLWLDSRNQRHLLNLTIPHMIFDGWSKDVLMADLGMLYRDGGADRRPAPEGSIVSTSSKCWSGRGTPSTGQWGRPARSARYLGWPIRSTNSPRRSTRSNGATGSAMTKRVSTRSRGDPCY